MIRKKICMLGAFAVGKTSLVRRYVKQLFSEEYYTTVGVRIDRKTVKLDDNLIEMVLWDIHGEEELKKVQQSYLTGSSGNIFVADVTRKETLKVIIGIKQETERVIGKVPFVLVLNKIDLADEIKMDLGAVEQLKKEGWKVQKASAKTGDGVEDAFRTLATDMVGK